MSHAFEAKVPFDCLWDLINIVRSGELATKKLEAAQHAAWFVGCAAESLKNKPPVFSELPDSYDDMSDEQLADELATLVPTFTAVPTAGDDPAAIDPATLITIITLIMKLFANRKK